MAEKKFRPNEELKELFEAGALNDIKLLFSGFDIQNQEWSLIEASRLGYLSLVQYFIEVQKLNVNKTSGDFQRTPIFWACGSGNLEIVKYLHSKGADFNFTERYGRSCLMFACEKGHLSVVRFLIEVGKVDFNYTQSDASTAFIYACKFGQLEIVKYMLLVVGCRFIGEKYILQKHAVVVAVQESRFEVLKFLVENGCLEDKQDKFGKNLVHIAADSCKNLQVLKYLIEDLRCEFNERDSLGRTPFDISCGVGNLEFVKYFISIGCNFFQQSSLNRTHVELAIYYGQFETMKYLISIGATVDKIETTAFAPATPNEKTFNILSYLISIGTKLPSKGKQSFLLGVISWGHLETVKMIIENGGLSQKQEPNELGQTPLQIASHHGFTDIVKYLIVDLKCEVNTQDSQGRTAFWCAASNSQLETMSILIENGANIEKQSKSGHSPLLIASSNRRMKAIEFLIEKGADLNVADNEGQTVLLSAIKIGDLEEVKLLIEKGADPNFGTKLGTPFSFAKKYDHPAIAKYLTSLRSNKKK